jgi:hypothetical protein
MAEFNFDNLAANLPDALRKDKDSNNYKLLLIEKKIYDRLLQILYDVEACMDIDNCSGATLDLWGQRQQIARGTADDNQYRLLVKATIGQNLCDGSRNSIADALAHMLSCDPNKIRITSGTKKNSVSVIDIPLATIRQAEFTEEQITDTITKLLAEGVTLESINYSGTFELGEAWGENDPDKGLADLERTIGGTLGMVRR